MTKIVLRKEIPEYFFFFENFNIYVYFLLIKSILIIFLFEDFFVKIIKKILNFSKIKTIGDGLSCTNALTDPSQNECKLSPQNVGSCSTIYYTKVFFVSLLLRLNYAIYFKENKMTKR